MDALLARHLVSSIFTSFPRRWHSTNGISEELIRFHLPPRIIKKQAGCSCIMSWSKQSAYRDFQDFVKPSRLLPAREANLFTKYISDETFSSLELDTSSSLYIVELRTSKDFGSCLSDLNAGILFSLIDANGNGDSLLQRISAVSLEGPREGSDAIFSETIHFQRGSVDIVTFEGPKLRRIVSLWIGLESGSWKLDGIRLTLLNGPLSISSSIEAIQEDQLDVLQYNFEANNMLFGEGGESVAELRPALIQKLPRDIFASFIKNMNPSPSMLESVETSNVEGMREYSDLKFSLLIYDSILIFLGSAIVLTVSSSERDAFSFLVGGIVGLGYLLLLQRSVDGLPIGDKREDLVKGIGTIKGPILSLAVIATTTVVAAKYCIGNSSVAMTATELYRCCWFPHLQDRGYLGRIQTHEKKPKRELVMRNISEIVSVQHGAQCNRLKKSNLYLQEIR